MMAASRKRVTMIKPALVSIVDDDESVCKALKRLIQSLGLKAKTFASAEEFLRSPHLYDSACLILDVVMPGLSGLDLQRNLVATKQHIPIVFITAHDDEHKRQQALDLGAAAFLRKPFSEQTLINILETVLNAQEKRPQAVAQQNHRK
jgi:FixJ family two-component response regulator